MITGMIVQAALAKMSPRQCVLLVPSVINAIPDAC